MRSSRSPDAIRAAKAVSVYRKIEAEVETPADALMAAEAGADIILLDNMTPGQVRDTLDLPETCRSPGSGKNREYPGGLPIRHLPEYAVLDVDVISMGALTHTVKNFSVTLEIFPGNDQNSVLYRFCFLLGYFDE